MTVYVVLAHTVADDVTCVGVYDTEQAARVAVVKTADEGHGPAHVWFERAELNVVRDLGRIKVHT